MIRNNIFLLSLMVGICSFSGCRDRELVTDKEQNPGKPEIKTKIVSDPTGAAVFIDGKFIDVTPLKMMPLSSGVLHLELAGYKTITTRVEDHAGSVSGVRILEFDLELLPKEPQE